MGMVDRFDSCYLNTMDMKRIKESIKKYRWLIPVILIGYSIKGIAVLWMGWKIIDWIKSLF
jgi:hypothetical protein